MSYFAHWGCEETDPGDQNCAKPGTAGGCQQLNFNSTPPSAQPGQCRGRFDYIFPEGAKGFSGGCEPDTTMGVTFFVPPASRMIANPNGIMLVYYDDVTDWDNASVALKYAIDGYQAGAFTLLGIATGGVTHFAFQPKGQPLSLCNYTRLNDLSVRATAAHWDEKKGYVTVPEPYDTLGHPWRNFAFARPFSAYLQDAPWGGSMTFPELPTHS